MGAPGQIPWTAVQQYADAMELVGDERYIFTQVIRRVDHVYLEWVRQRQETERKAQEAKMQSSKVKH